MIGASNPLRQLRALGLPMRGAYPPYESQVGGQANEQVAVMRQRWIGWTTDEEKARAAKDAGAVVTPYSSSDARFSGWEVTVSVVVES